MLLRLCVTIFVTEFRICWSNGAFWLVEIFLNLVWLDSRLGRVSRLDICTAVLVSGKTLPVTCMAIGEFPDSWKIAHITLIPKAHSPTSSSEYRPISVHPVLSKLFEKVLYHRAYSYLTEHNLIDKRQYGFRENHSTELAITTIHDELLRNFDNKLITCFLFLELSKAFDYGDHEILLDKLYHYGIGGVSHKLFSNFLHNRMQCNKIGAFKSSYKRISCRVTQGIVISPLLSLSTLTISQKLLLFILLYLLMILISICQTPVLMSFRQRLTLNYVKSTTGWEPTNFLLITVRPILCS